jgi:hypothetical protein
MDFSIGFLAGWTIAILMYCPQNWPSIVGCAIGTGIYHGIRSLR